MREGLAKLWVLQGEKLWVGGKQPRGVGLFLELKVGSAVVLLEHCVPHPVPVGARAKLGPCHTPEWDLSLGGGG